MAIQMVKAKTVGAPAPENAMQALEDSIAKTELAVENVVDENGEALEAVESKAGAEETADETVAEESANEARAEEKPQKVGAKERLLRMRGNK